MPAAALPQFFLVTGATSGLGLAAARALLADHPERVLVTGVRDPVRAAALRGAVPDRQLVMLPLDLASLASVRGFAAALRQRLAPGGRLEGIACNAGIQVFGPRRRSAEGHELTFATNHLGHFLLLQEVLDFLTPGGAVVSTASGTHDPADAGARRFGYRGGLFPSAQAVARGELDPSAYPPQQGRDFYATSKLCNVLTTYALAARIPTQQARFIAFDPGLMPGTGLARGMPWFMRAAWHGVMPALARLMPGASTPARSGIALARLLTEASLAPASGLHLDFRIRETPSSDLSRRQDVQDDLHALSKALCATAPLRSAA